MKWLQKIIALCFLFAAGSASLYASSENLNLRFRFGKSETDVSALENILTGEKASQIKTIVIKGFSSPDGPYWVNKDLAEKRATYIYNKVRELCPDLDADAVRVETVAEDWSGVAAWLRRSNKPYKEEAIKIVTEGEKNSREEKLQDLWAGEAWDDLMHSAFPALRCVKVSIEYAAPKVSLEVPAGDGAQIASTDSNSVRILFPSGIRYVQPEYAGNSAQLQLLRNLVAGGKSLRIESYASPEGDPVCNAALAENRAKCAKKWISENLGIPEDRISVVSSGEDWGGLLREVRENYSGDNRDVVVDILGNESLSNASKKASIRDLDGNVTWRNLVLQLMPALRAVTITVE